MILFITLGVCMVGVAITLNVGWIILVVAVLTTFLVVAFVESTRLDRERNIRNGAVEGWD